MIAIGPAGFGQAPRAQETPVAADLWEQARRIKLSPVQQQWLALLAQSRDKCLSSLVHQPPLRTMNSLVRKGLAYGSMDRFWEISHLGAARYAMGSSPASPKKSCPLKNQAASGRHKAQRNLR